MKEAFRLRDVSKTYKGFALHVNHLSLEQGYVMGLVGRNGAGKSTCIKILMNLIYPDSGDVRVLGMRQPEDELEIKRRVGYVSEDPRFYETMTVGWTAGFVGRYYPTWDDGLYRGYLAKFALDPNKKIVELSRGMRVRLGLMLALSHSPEFLVLDEPTSGIDPIVRHELLREIAAVVKDEERTVLISSHLSADIEQIADYITIIDDGKVVVCSDKEAMMDGWKKVTGVLEAREGGAADAVAAMFRDFTAQGRVFAGITGSFTKGWLENLKSKGVSDVRIIGLTLDEILISLVGKGGKG